MNDGSDPQGPSQPVPLWTGPSRTPAAPRAQAPGELPAQAPVPAGSAPRNVTALLVRLHQEGYSGTVSVSGAPGGTIHLRNGLISAIETPGTPSVESALLKSGRIGDEGWASALAATQDVAGLGAALVGQGLVGETELEVLCTATIYEGAFAMALTRPDGWEVGAPAQTVLAGHPAQPQSVAEETARRLAFVTARWGSPGELARTRLRPSVTAERAAGRLAPRHTALLALANGRRTPRDLAFFLGRGLFAVMVDLIRMDELKLVQWEGDRRPAGRPSTAPRVPGAGATTGGSGAAPPPAGSLPRRVPGPRPQWAPGVKPGAAPTPPGGATGPEHPRHR
ncbi:hypothetical protein ACIQVO_05235 [Streptomyces sp. NPDC101062]|uniref:hypothetical protein n=1 Tax=unclassified Streptomyces TaxID=2593676 RepID=UPI0037FCFD8B